MPWAWSGFATAGVELDARDKPADLSEEEWELTKHKLVFKFVDSLLEGEPEVRHFDKEKVATVVVDRSGLV